MMTMQMDVLAGWLGQWELWVILVIALLIFGKRLPEIARGLGKSLTSFKKGLKDVEQDIEEAGKEEDKPSETKQVDSEVKQDQSEKEKDKTTKNQQHNGHD